MLRFGVLLQSCRRANQRIAYSLHWESEGVCSASHWRFFSDAFYRQPFYHWFLVMVLCAFFTRCRESSNQFDSQREKEKNGMPVFFSFPLFLFYVSGLFASMCVCALYLCLVPLEVRKGHQISWDQIQLGTTMWVLGVELVSSGKSRCS